MSTITPEAPEARLFPPAIEIRELETTTGYRHLSGIAVPYGRQTDIGGYLESFEPGAFAKSINRAADRRYRNGNGLPLLMFHDSSKPPIGVSVEWIEESEGLRGVWRLDKSDEAQNAARLAADGMLSGMSVRFAPIESRHLSADRMDENGRKRLHVVRTEARLLETSLVSTPAYEGASVQFVRTSEPGLRPDVAGEEIAGWRRYLDEVR